MRMELFSQFPVPRTTEGFSIIALRPSSTPLQTSNSALYLVSEMSTAVTGEIHYVDCGFNIVGMPKA